jgi:diacylglycerol kinase family enzyme
MQEGATCISAMGGDGTVRSVASAVHGTAVPLGVIPGGTLNHFARDVGVGRNVEEALRVLAAGHVEEVDVACVNDQLFLNNSSIGLYPRMVAIRERYERRLGKWRAILRATLLVARGNHSIIVEIQDGESVKRFRTYLLFIGNNQYEFNLLHLGQRATLEGGELCCFILEAPNRLSLLPSVFHYLRERNPEEHLFRSMCLRELTVIPRYPGPLGVATDGEVLHLTPPLRYKVLPRSLKVVVPKPPPEGSREVR